MGKCRVTKATTWPQGKSRQGQTKATRFQIQVMKIVKSAVVWEMYLCGGIKAKNSSIQSEDTARPERGIIWTVTHKFGIDFVLLLLCFFFLFPFSKCLKKMLKKLKTQYFKIYQNIIQMIILNQNDKGGTKTCWFYHGSFLTHLVQSLVHLRVQFDASVSCIYKDTHYYCNPVVRHYE